MTRRRWIADEVIGDRAALVGAHAQHLSKTLRARIGQEFDIATSNGLRRGRIMEVAKDRVEFELGEEIPASGAPDITLLISVFKFDRMEWAIEKCTELGAARIVPVLARRTEKHLSSAAEKRWDRWQRLVQQAAEQSRRTRVPDMMRPARLQDAMLTSAETCIVLSEVELELSLKDAVDGAKSVALAFGPEGGWTESELKLFGEAGWVSASLGGTILRAETAAIAGVAVAIAEMNG